MEIALNLVVLLLALTGWYFFSFRVLRYMIDASEGRWKWELAGFLALLCICIFLSKFALHSTIGWPQPGTWSSRLYLGFGLVASYLVPFVKSYLEHYWNKRNR